jgi:hypothetical protein
MHGFKALAVALALAVGAVITVGTSSRAEAAAQPRPVAEYALKIVTYNYDEKGKLVGQRTSYSGRYKLRSDADNAARATSKTYTSFGRKTVIVATVVYAK